VKTERKIIADVDFRRRVQESGHLGRSAAGGAPSVFGRKIACYEMRLSAPTAWPHTSLGHRPRDLHFKELGLKARAITLRGIVRAFSPYSPFQFSWGVAPGWYWTDLWSSKKRCRLAAGGTPTLLSRTSDFEVNQALKTATLIS